MATTTQTTQSSHPNEAKPPNTLAVTVAMLALGAMAAVFLCSQYTEHAAKAQMATVRIDVVPRGAQVSIDGKFVGSTPATVEQIALGEHMLRVEKHGYEPLRKTIVASSQNQTIQGTLTKIAKAGLTVSSEPTGASVHIDGQYVGRTPISLHDLSPGEHSVLVEKSGFDPWQDRALLRQDQTEKISCELKSRMESVLAKQAAHRPDDVLAHTQLAHYHILKHNFEEARKALSRALALVAGLHSKDEKVRWVREEMSKAYKEEYDYGDDEAVAKCRDMLEAALIAECKARPSQTMARKLLFKLVKEAGRWRRLAQAFGPEGIPLDKSEPIAVAGYGEALVHAGRTDEALKLLLPAHGRHRRCWQITYALGFAYKQKGERVKAKIKFKQALLHCTDPNGQAMIRSALGKR